MIELNSVVKTYKGGHTAVNNLNLTIQDGEVFGFLGHNGAGKSTTIKMITGILQQTSGQIKINGVDTLVDPIKAKSQCAFVPDSPDMFLKLTGIEYLTFMCNIYRVPAAIRKKRVDHLVAIFNMEKALGDRIQSYSHGMRQKIIVIGALIHDPSVWILDEPITGLDPESAFKLKEMMRDHADRGHSVFFSTHVLEVAERMCDRIGIIKQGELLFQGTVEQLKQQYDIADNEPLENIFLELTKHE